MYYDLVGQPLAQTYSASAFGLSTSLDNASSSLSSATAPRYTGFYSPPASLFPPAPAAGFPATYPNLFAITNSIDDTLKAPYTMNTDFSIGREFGHGWFVQGAYVMRQSRRSLVNKDLAQPTNLVDSKSGQTYYQAAQSLAAQYNNGVNPVPVANVAKIPFWEDLWPGLAGNGLTATQGAYKQFGAGYSPDYTSALQAIDINCSPSCSVFGPGAIFNEQFSALSAWSSVGRGDYYSMQWSVRKRFSDGLTMNFNYTLGSSRDLASSSENGGSFSGVLQNDWVSQQSWAYSNYDARHILNTFVVYQLPFGKNRRFLAGANRGVDAFIGGWQLAPTAQWSQRDSDDRRRWQQLGDQLGNHGECHPDRAGHDDGRQECSRAGSRRKGRAEPVRQSGGGVQPVHLHASRQQRRPQCPAHTRSVRDQSVTVEGVLSVHDSRQSAQAAVPLGDVQPDQYCGDERRAAQRGIREQFRPVHQPARIAQSDAVRAAVLVLSFRCWGRRLLPFRGLGAFSFYQPTGFPRFCSASHFSSGAK